MRVFKATALLLGFTSVALSAFAADTATFNITNKAGRSIGKASYVIDKKKDGTLNIRSKYEYRTGIVNPKSDDPDAIKAAASASNIQDNQFSTEYKIDPSGNFVSGLVQNSSNQMMNSFTPSKARDSVLVGSVQAGNQGQSRDIPMPKPDFLLAPDYDPAGLQILVLTVLNHPHTDRNYYVLVPGNGPGAKGLPRVDGLATAQVGEAKGTLDGKEVTLKHFLVKYVKGQADLYADTDGNLMQANLGNLSVQIVRAKFELAK